MIKQCRKNNLPEPEFIQKMGHFITVIWKDIFTEKYLSDLGLNERQIKAVKYVKENQRITNKEYREVCQTSDRTATRDLTQLVLLKVFKQIGVTGKGTEYVLRRHKDAKDATKTP
jgi:ATP-dependent DNA helicase RecG